MHLKTQIKIALFYFLIAALFGVILRITHFTDVVINYRYLVHAHSHIALLGWIYTAITAVISKLFLAHKILDKSYKRIFWSTQISIIGMMLTFPFIGYTLISIFFSSYFIINTYLFIRLFFKYRSASLSNLFSYTLIKAALCFLVLSSIGPWALGVIMNTLGSASFLYRNAIYFYLHFQYNGWFIVGVLGVLFYILNKHDILKTTFRFRLFYWLFILGVILTFGISLLWMKPHPALYVLAAAGSLLQISSILYLGTNLKAEWQKMSPKISSTQIVLFKTIAVLFGFKLLFQLLGCFPIFSDAATANLELVIAYLHWVFLGIVSIAILVYFDYFKMLTISKTAATMYVVAFLTTEILLIYKGTVGWAVLDLNKYYYQLLFATSLLFLVAISLLLKSAFTRSFIK